MKAFIVIPRGWVGCSGVRDPDDVVPLAIFYTELLFIPGFPEVVYS